MSATRPDSNIGSVTLVLTDRLLIQTDRSTENVHVFRKYLLVV